MKRNWLMRVTVLIALAVTVPAWGGQTETLTGTVVDATGRPLHGVIVSAFDQELEMSTSVLTDMNGRFVLNRLPAKSYDVRARQVGFDDTVMEGVDLAAGKGKGLKLKLEPTSDLLAQRTGTSLFGEMRWEDEAQRMSFKMSCTYCHQVGTTGFRTPEEPVDWEVMITRMDGFGALHPDLKETVVQRLVDTYTDKGVTQWADYTPPPAPSGRSLSLRVQEWDMGLKPLTMIHDLELGKDGMVYAVDMINDALFRLDPATGERKIFAIPGGKNPLDADEQMILGPHSVEADAEGDMWLTLAIGGKMAKFDVDTEEWTVVSGAPDPRPRGGYPHTLRLDQQGVVWYTDAGLGVFKLDPNQGNQRTFYKLPRDSPEGATGIGESRGRTPYGIDVAPDGMIWYTQLNANRIGRIDPNVEGGAIKEWVPPFTGPRRLHVAADGLVWVPGCGSGVFGSFNPATEKWKVYDLPDKENQFPYALNVHPKTGDVWICGTTSDSMFRFIPDTEELIEYPMPSRVTYTREIEFGDDGSIWVCNSNWPNRHTERGVGSIIRISLDGTVAEGSPAQRITTAAAAP